MLLRLNPRTCQSSVIYHINYCDHPETLPLPTGWEAQLHRIATDNLEVPDNVYVLDKATWLVALMREATFDLENMLITCCLLDGTKEQWPLTSRACIEVLEGVLDDVEQYGLEVNMERRRTELPTDSTPQPVNAKLSKHKKQRSVLVSFLTSLLPGSHGSTSVSPILPSSSMHTPSSAESSTAAIAESSVAARFLRRRARAALVDMFRRFIVAELARRASPGGFYAWVARSMLRRAQSHMAYLVQEAGGFIPEFYTAEPRSRTGMHPSATAIVSECTLYDDEDMSSMTDSSSTDTDGSSVHTPVESPVPGRKFHTKKAYAQVPRSPSPPGFSPEDLATYTALSGRCVQLRQLIVHMDIVHVNIASEERNILTVLEIKSRRRAWSNKDHMGRALVKDVALGAPIRRSPLGRFEPITAESLCVGVLDVATADHNILQLFPVSEEEEEEDQHSTNGRDSDVSLNNETGVPSLSRPPIRMRTQSMYSHHGLHLDPSLIIEEDGTLADVQAPVMQMTPTIASPRYHQSLKKTHIAPDPQHQVETFEELTFEDSSSEFTLEMDLPHTQRRYDHDEWLPGASIDIHR